jgi:hypothetical protein
LCNASVVKLVYASFPLSLFTSDAYETVANTWEEKQAYIM